VISHQLCVVYLIDMVTGQDKTLSTSFLLLSRSRFCRTASAVPRYQSVPSLRRMGKAYVDGIFPDEEYYRQKKLLEMELESLVVPAADAAEEAGKLILNLHKLWIEANLEEKRKLLLSMMDAVYVDAKQTKSIVAIKSKPPFRPIFQVVVTRAGSQIGIINEPLEGSAVFLVETGEPLSLPETRILCFV